MSESKCHAVGIESIPVDKAISVADDDQSSTAADCEPEKKLNELNDSIDSQNVPQDNRKRKILEDGNRDVSKRRCLDGAALPTISDIPSASVSFTPDVPPDKDSPISYLPDELLLKIFQYCSQSEGSLLLYKRIFTVCHRWHRLSSDRQFWKDVDLSYDWVQKTGTVWQQLCSNNFSKLSQLTVKGWTSGLDIKLLLDCSPNLHRLDISRSWLSRDAYIHIGQFYHLRELKITSMINKDICQQDKHFTAGIQKIIVSIGKSLQVLNISGNSIIHIRFQKILNKVARYCHNLTELDLRYKMTRTSEPAMIWFPVKKLQQNCTEMKVLRVPVGVGVMYKPSPYGYCHTGFPHLQEFTAGHMRNPTDPVPPMGILDGELLISLVHRSRDLKVIDISNCVIRGLGVPYPSKVPYKWSQLSFPKLEYLYMSKALLPERFLAAIEPSFRTLRVLNLSGVCESEVWDEMIHAVTIIPSTLEELDLSDSTVTLVQIQHILLHCPHLRYLDLTFCRYLRCAFAHCFQTKQKVQRLKERVARLCATRRRLV